MLSALLMLQSVNPDMGDMQQLGDLMEHAGFHSEKYGDSFLVFLSKHYGAMEQDHKMTHREEQSEHEELPFNHHACNHAPAQFVIFARPFPSLRSNQPVATRSDFYYQETNSSFETFDIFQPPRNA